MYEEMTFENLMEEMLGHVREDVDKREGSVIWDATAAVAYSLAEMYFCLANYPDLLLPDTAVGEYLERFAVLFGIERKPAVCAVRQVTAAGHISVGSRWQSEETTYVVTECTADGEYTAVCEQPGTVGNQYSGVLQPIHNKTEITAMLGKIIFPGSDAETDDALRDRLFQKIRRPSIGGNANDYYNWAMSCAGVGAARVFPLAEGPGTVKVVLADEAGRPVETGIAEQTAAYIESVRPVGASVTVVPAQEKQVNVTARIQLAPGALLGTAEAAFEKTANAFLCGKAFRLDYISLARFGNLLLDVEGIEDYAELRINGTAENLEIRPEETAVLGTVRLEVGEWN